MTRLDAALAEGLQVQLGRALVLRPPVGMDLSALGDAHVVATFKPAYDHFAAMGRSVSVRPEGRYAVALVCITRAKEESRGLIADAAAHAPLVLVDGSKTDGIESLLKEVKRRLAVDWVTSKAHGKLFAFQAGDFSDWRAVPRQVDGFTTAPGVFSADAIDPASHLLVEALPKKLSGTVADLGAGWGYLSHRILARPEVAAVHLVEADHTALSCAKLNVTDPRAVFHWADATRIEVPTPVDAVVMNPPFHQGRAAEPALGQAFIASAARLLKPNGKLWCVANRHLPYEQEAARLFQTVSEVAGDRRFKVLLAEKPRRRAR
ncbi:MAG: class I SAM-dependent methyltransferase [Pseudomonadota bacterium]